MLSVIGLATLLSSPASAAGPPLQATWVAAANLAAPDGVRRAINAAVAAGIDTIVAPAPLYAGSIPDPFAELVRQAHERQLRVFASIDIDRVALPDEVPASRNHIFYQHPEWLMVPRALAPEVLALDVRSPEYIGRLTRWTRANGVDGVYVSPLTDDAVAFVAAAAAGVAARYPVDGVQLDAARYPAGDFDYGRRALEAFRRQVRPTLGAPELQRIDADEAIDPFAYPNAYPDLWRQFRQRQQTRLVTEVRDAIREARAGVPVIAAVSGVADADLEQHFQDWRTWIERRLIDAVSVRSGTMTRIVADAAALVAIADAGSSSGSR